MSASLDEVLSMMREWRSAALPVRLAYARPGLTLWYPRGTIKSASGSVFVFSFNVGEFSADIAGCDIEFDLLKEVPKNFYGYMTIPTESVLQIRSNDGGLLLMYVLNKQQV